MRLFALAVLLILWIPSAEAAGVTEYEGYGRLREIYSCNTGWLNPCSWCEYPAVVTIETNGTAATVTRVVTAPTYAMILLNGPLGRGSGPCLERVGTNASVVFDTCDPETRDVLHCYRSADPSGQYVTIFDDLSYRVKGSGSLLRGHVVEHPE